MFTTIRTNGVNRSGFSNSYGPLFVTKAFLPFIKSSGRIVMISSGGGVLNGYVVGWSPAYCVSKTLLNAITKQLAYELKSKIISVNAVCPGWVRTDLGGAGATRAVEKGAETIRFEKIAWHGIYVIYCSLIVNIIRG